MLWEKKGIIYSDGWAQVPVVDIEYDGFARIFFSKRIDNKSIPMYFDVDKTDLSKVLRKYHKPILSIGKPGRFDSAGVMPTEIVNYKNEKYLYYIGWSNRVDVPYFNNLGLAVSSDKGKTFQKAFEGPVLGCSRKEPGYVGTVKIMIENGIWRAWYLSCRDWILVQGRMEPKYDIKYAESLDGIDWDIKNITCIELESGEGGISQASIIKVDQKYHMWFSVRGERDFRNGEENSYSIRHAESYDGVSWKRTKNFGLFKSNEGWDSGMVAYPYVFLLNEKINMFYNGNGFGQSGVGRCEGDIKKIC